MTDLKKCPFCGGEDTEVSVNYEYGDGYEVSCNDCDSDVFAKTKDEAVKRWNNRPLEDTLQSKVKTLREALEEDKEIWTCAKSDLNRMDDFNHRVRFMELHDPIGKVDKALKDTE